LLADFEAIEELTNFKFAEDEVDLFLHSSRRYYLARYAETGKKNNVLK
jgi:hypothetical protein